MPIREHALHETHLRALALSSVEQNVRNARIGALGSRATFGCEDEEDNRGDCR
jgi:hypothetical protein